MINIPCTTIDRCNNCEECDYDALCEAPCDPDNRCDEIECPWCFPDDWPR